MAGERIILNGAACFIDYEDGEGSAVVNGRTWRWSFHEYCGPTFLRKDGEALKHIPREGHPVWDAFDEWLKKWRENNYRPAQSSKGPRIKLDIK